jgi:3-phosphoshikimate 1-carboxyvinyltransferase
MKTRTIHPADPINAEVTMPGSKSYTARALVAGALAPGESLLRNALLSEDGGHMIDGLRSLGVSIREEAEGLRIVGTGGTLHPRAGTLHLGGAGTAVRFLTTVAGLAGREIVLDGNPRMRERPIQDLLDALGPLGIRARTLHGNGCPPVVVEGGSFEGGRTRLKGGKSSQFLSSLLLCGPCARKETVVEVEEDLVSRSYVEMTMETMAAFGADVGEEKGRQLFRVSPGGYRGREYFIEGDFSSASYFFAAAAVTGGRVVVKGIEPSSKQGDRGLMEVLLRMGCRVSGGDHSVEVVGGELNGVEVDMKIMPDTVPTVAVVAAFARGETRILHVDHLRYKETDRLASLGTELSKMGIETRQEKEAFVIRGGKPRGAEIETYNDHRMAMAFAVAGLRAPGTVIRDPDCVGKSMPAFWTLFGSLR